MDMEYADDIAIICEDSQEAQNTLDRLEALFLQFGMVFAATKRKVLLQDWQNATRPLTLGDDQLRVVDKFMYLGCCIGADGMSHEVANRITKAQGVLKIADFGLARLTVSSVRPDRPTRYTARVVTLWYRPPEILLNDRSYGRPVDLWGAGCIMAELWTRYPIMQGDNELAQLNLIIQLCGSITPEIWPSVKHLEAFQKAKLPRDVKRHVKEKLTPQISCPSAVDLIDKLLVLDPSKRLDADQALSHDFFHEDPPPSDLSSLSKSGNCYLEYSGQVNRTRHLAGNNYRGVPPAHNFAQRRLPGPIGIPPGLSIQQPQGGAAGHYRYRGLPPDEDSSNISDRIF
ncbi:cyclin-dependent kinase 9 [Paragonimus westermani]|uniref:Cyclin-dependent kinase 9 n=1 Tax=Paragonimus westermani TaxID=34504 RepID=A0A5J4N5Z7_9TREM|nr:cyclin-dependent kinase 9 [Paragonimus westermani]